MFLLLISLVLGSVFAGNSVLFPNDKSATEPVKKNTFLKRFGWSVIGPYKNAQDRNIDDRFLIPIQTPKIMQTVSSDTTSPPLFATEASSPTEFSLLPTLFTAESDSITFPTTTFFPTGISPLLTSDYSQFMPTYATCDCLPTQLCVNHSALNVITTRVVTKPPTGVVCPPDQVYCCVETSKLGCGIPNIIPGVNPDGGQAHLGQFPWSAIILTNDNAYVAGGVLIDSSHVLSVAHRLASYDDPTKLKVRFGDWDVSNEDEPVGYLEIKIKKIINHPKFEAASLKNDISLVVLDGPVSTLTRPFPQINSICLPDASTMFTGLRCKISGWGKDQFDGSYQNIIKEVEVPVLDSASCQAMLRKTKLGMSFTLDANSFICAGGELGKDACTGDGGNALACMVNGKYFVAGIAAGGIQCGHKDVPGLYVNMVSYLPWLNELINGYESDKEVFIDPRKNHN